MRTELPERLEAGRVLAGPYGSEAGSGVFGAFRVQGPCGEQLIIMSNGICDHQPWEHVSVSTQRRTPNWQEMCFVKDLFWNDDEYVVQFHPAKSEYVNNHPHCLHLWRHRDGFPTPPWILVGIKDRAPT